MVCQSVKRLRAADLKGPLNLSLLHQRYSGLPPRVEDREGRDTQGARGSPVKEACDTFVDAFAAQAAHAGPLLALTHERLDHLGGAPLDPATPVGGHVWLDLTLTTTLAVGLGNEHPFENGLTLHHTIGAPFLPGSTLKGLIRAWRALNEEDEDDTRRWLGWEDKDHRQHHRGALTFLDALPLTWPRLGVELINNHLPAYYRGTGNRGAVPKESPVPVFLLVVQPGTRWRFRVGAARDLVDRERAVREVLTGIADALALLGVGARKANGYGIFDR